MSAVPNLIDVAITADAIAAPEALRTTPLNALHRELGAKLVPFAGYEMPVSYPRGILSEHRHTRASAGLFDVSHMGQIRLSGAEAASALESLVPIDVAGLVPGQQRYGFFTSNDGGLLDDLMVTRLREGLAGGDLLLIVNAACKDTDLAHLQRHIGQRCTVQPLPELALIALQGPKAVDALARLNPAVAALTFMTGGRFALDGIDCHLTRSGYTGEDGFEISVPAVQAEALARALLAQPEVAPVGLGARDTLRLEAGLCLYGHDIDASTSPIEASLAWAIQKVRRAGGARAGGYPGAAFIDQHMAQGVARKRVGLVGLQLAPVREGAELVDAAGQPIGRVTSGTVGPTAEKPIAIGYVAIAHAAVGSEVQALVRGKPLPMRVVPLPFVAHRYVRG